MRCTPVCDEHVLIELSLSDFPVSQPGQFLQVLCRGDEAFADDYVDWSEDELPSLSGKELGAVEAFLRRPLSIADRWETSEGDTRVCLISRSVGTGTRWLERLRSGDRLDVTGPLGTGFRIPEEAKPVVLIGGGVGIPPLLYLARRLHALGRRDVTAAFGVRSRTLLPVSLRESPRTDGQTNACVEYPGGACYDTLVASDDGSVGTQGLVADVVRRWWRGRRDGGGPVTVFACGPEAMLKAVGGLSRELGWDCQLCIERQMGCGLGTCLSCAVRVGDSQRPEGWRWALACQDGPVFERDDLLDYRVDQRA